MSEASMRRDEGMAAAVAHADRVVPSWGDKANAALRAFVAASPGVRFIAMDVRDYAEVRGLAEPPDNRAWGYIMRKAALAGLIRKVGYAASPDPARHCGIATLWEVKL